MHSTLPSTKQVLDECYTSKWPYPLPTFILPILQDLFLPIKKLLPWTSSMAQGVQYLPRNCKALSSNLSNNKINIKNPS